VSADRVEELVRAHGHDTLAHFKLRGDHDHVFSRDGRALAGFRVEAGVLMVSADPVGPPEALSALAREVRDYARARGLRLAVFAASETGRRLFAGVGLRSMYLGDEAIVDARAFSLHGRPIRKVRQSVNRLGRAGYTTELRRLGDLDEPAVAELEALAERARDGAPEHGFAMEMDGLRGRGQPETTVLVARDPSGAARGLLHFVPCHGRPARSLSLMRRDRGTPNGLSELMVVRAIEGFRAEGIEELSLNFATFARWITAPATRVERVLGRIVATGDRWFQIESMYRFNAKFFPGWTPRYLLFESRRELPRAALAALRAEGLVPAPIRRDGGPMLPPA
jgi:lysyl-tRNA synthetase class 2